jgi:pilus assembly protein Flp/PilA
MSGAGSRVEAWSDVRLIPDDAQTLLHSIRVLLIALSSRRRHLVQKIISRVHRFLINDDGPTAVEYAVMLALILVACITIVQSLGTSVSGVFSSVNGTVS